MTDHADEELANDEILDDDLFHSVLCGEVLEDYVGDKPFPSCLVCGNDLKGGYVHGVCAYSDEQEIAIAITGHIPDPDRWIDNKIRSG